MNLEDNKELESKMEEKMESEPEADEADAIAPAPWRISLRKTNSTLNLNE